MLKLFKNIFRINNFYKEAQGIFKRKDWSQALTLYQKSLQVEPDFRPAYLGKSKCYFNMNRLQEARQNLQQFGKQTPNHNQLQQYYILHGRLCMENKKFDLAIKFFDDAINLHEQDEIRATIYKLFCLSSSDRLGQHLQKIQRQLKTMQNKNLIFEKAWILFTLKNYKESIIQFDKYLTYQKNHFAYFYKGSSERYLEFYGEAEKSFRASLQYNPQFLDSIFALSDVLTINNNYQQALQLSKIGIEINPKIEYGYFNRSFCYFKLQKYQQAIKSFTQSLRIQENPLSYFFRGISYVMLGKPKQAQLDFRKKLLIDPDNQQNCQIYCNLGMIYFRQQKYKQALIQFEHGEALDPNDAQVLHLKGRCLSVMGKKQQAVKYFKKAISLDPNQIDIQMNLAAHYLINKQPQSAYDITNRCYQIYPQDINILFAKVSIQRQLNKFEDGLNTLQKILELSPENDVALSTKAMLLNIIGKNTEADQILKQLIIKFPNELSYYVKRASILKEMGEQKQGENLINQALKIAPNESFLIQARKQLFRK